MENQIKPKPFIPSMKRSLPAPSRILCLLSISLILWPGAPLRVEASGGNLTSAIDRHVKSLRARGSVHSNERTAWVVYDLTSDRELASINANVSMQAASMIKPYLALAYFHEVNAGRLTYNDTARRHMEQMLQRSNNPSTNWVMRQTGGPAATEALLKRHYPSISGKIRLVEYIPEGGRTYRNQGSAQDYAMFLRALWKRQLPRSEELLRIMGLPGNNRLYTRVPAVPQGTRLYNKTGSTAMCCGDMGILVARGRNGREYPYILVGVIESSQRNSANYSSWITARANVIRSVSGLVYENMKRRYPL